MLVATKEYPESVMVISAFLQTLFGSWDESVYGAPRPSKSTISVSVDAVVVIILEAEYALKV